MGFKNRLFSDGRDCNSSYVHMERTKSCRQFFYVYCTSCRQPAGVCCIPCDNSDINVQRQKRNKLQMVVLCILSGASVHFMGNMYVLRDIVKKKIIKKAKELGYADI